MGGLLHRWPMLDKADGEVVSASSVIDLGSLAKHGSTLGGKGNAVYRAAPIKLI